MKVKELVLNNKKIDRRCPDLLHGDDGLSYLISCYGHNLSVTYQRPFGTEDEKTTGQLMPRIAERSNDPCITRRSEKTRLF
jgi:hypothetical protein